MSTHDTDRVQYTLYRDYDSCPTCGAPLNEPCANLRKISGYEPVLSTRLGAFATRLVPHPTRSKIQR